MKKTLLLLLACVPGLSAKAQTKTVAPKPQKLQQLYVSVGTGPAFTSDNYYRSHGGGFDYSIGAGFRSDLMLKLGIKNTGFVENFSQSPKGLFAYLNQFSYHTTYFEARTLNSYYAIIGKRRKLCDHMQLQAFAGISYNTISGLPQVGPDFPRELICDLTYAKSAGAIAQAELMLLPSRFAGLTVGTFFNYVPEYSHGGLTLSLNLGKLRPKPSQIL